MAANPTLDEQVKDIKADIDNISGKSPEDKEKMHMLFLVMSQAWGWFHGNKFNFLMGTLTLSAAANVLKVFGVDTTHLAPAILHFIEGYLKS